MNKPEPDKSYSAQDMQKYLEKKYKNFPRSSNRTFLLKWLIDRHDWLGQDSSYLWCCKEGEYDEESDNEQDKLIIDLITEEFGEGFYIQVAW